MSTPPQPPDHHRRQGRRPCPHSCRRGLSPSVLLPRLGAGQQKLAEPCDSGLPVRVVGRQRYILGSEAVAFFASLPADGEEGSP